MGSSRETSYVGPEGGGWRGTERDGGGGRRRTDNIGGTDIIRPGETPPEIEERLS
jgi:hypothetical protein